MGQKGGNLRQKKYIFIRFIYSEKATKLCEISTNYLTGSTSTLVEISQKFVAFSEYTDFINIKLCFHESLKNYYQQGWIMVIHKIVFRLKLLLFDLSISFVLNHSKARSRTFKPNYLLQLINKTKILLSSSRAALLFNVSFIPYFCLLVFGILVTLVA